MVETAEQDLRNSGIDIVGEVPWGTHFCQFYETGEDLLDILVPYFRAGLENDEFCMWVTAEPVGVADAEQALRKAVPNIDQCLQRGQLEIIPHSEWYLKGGFFNLQRVLTGWVDRLDKALAKGFSGMRLTGNTAWLEKGDWNSFTEYEQAIDNVIGRYRMVALCTYQVDRCGASEVADVISNHQFALFKRQGKWNVIESAERKRAEEQLRKLSRAVEQSSNTIVITNTAGRIEYANPRATELTGYAAKEVLGKTPSIFKSGKTPREAYKRLWETINSGGDWRGEFLNRKKNGELYWESASISPIRNSDGVITHFVAVKEDITERKRAEEALLRAHEELERRVEERTAQLAAANKELRAEITERERVERERDRFFALSLDMLCIAGVDGYFKRVNPAFEKTLGHSTSELLAKPFVEFIHPEDRPATISEVQKLAAGAPTLYFENRYRCKDGSYKWLAWTAVPDAATGSIFAVARDMTEQKRAEAEIKKLNEDLERRVIERTAQLEAANKELEAFAYSVSHDLRAPLRHIDGFSQALLEDCADKLDQEGKEYLNFVREASQSMAQLIDDLLKLSRVTRVEMRRKAVDLSGLAQEIATRLHSQQPERWVDFAITPEVKVDGDSNLLRLALDNLLGNAWKFTSRREQAKIEFGVQKQDGRQVYFVRDNGAGFNMAYASKLFGAFQRLHREAEFPGTGIGLATVQRIIHRHGGRIWAEGAVDKGATFYFTLE